MAIEDLKIKDAEFLSRSVKGLANRPVSSVGGYGRQDLSSAQLKERFDANGALLKERLNALIDALGSVSGAENIGISSRFTLNGDSVDTVAKLVAFLESDEAVEQIIYNGTQSLESVINGINATLTEQGLNITALNNFATNAVTKISASADENDKTITVALLDSNNNIKSEATVNVPSAGVDTATLASGIDGELSADSGLRVLTVAIKNADGNVIGYVDIPFPIPSEADEDNPLATRGFVNSSVQTATANFRGNYEYWEDVPESEEDYLEDYAGSTKPTTNDYLVVRDASSYPDESEAREGTWRFKYTGNWNENGKDGWHPEYQVNETPLTDAQLNSLNSGITAQIVGSIAGKLDKVTDADGNIEAYVKLADGTQAMIKISASVFNNSIILRDNTGHFYVAEATEDHHPVQLSQMNTALGGKVDKVTSTGDNRVYGVSSTGVNRMYGVGTTAAGGYLVQRRESGAVTVPNASDATDAVNLAQMTAVLPKIIRI